MKKIISMILLVVFLFTLAACSGSSSGTVVTSSVTPVESSTDPQQSLSTTSTPIPSIDFDSDDLDTSASGDNLSTIDLEGDKINFNGVGATVDGSTITITYAGVYTISGSLDDGQVIVDTESAETVHLILNGASITSKISAPIYVRKAEKVVITLADDTQNYVTDGSSYTLESGSDEPNAAIFSKSDLTINGNGALTVNANYENGITSKDNLKIVSGNVTVNAVKDAIRGRDSIAIQGGTFTLTAGGDGLQSNNDEDSSKGYISILGGTFIIIADNDGIQAETSLAIRGGDFTITTGGGSLYGTRAGQDDWGNMRPGFGSGNAAADDDTTDSSKGIKAGVDLSITGGTFAIDSADDALHSNDSLTIDGGVFQIASGDDGIHADTTLTINNGDLTITTSYEGLESQTIVINGGTIRVNASDDGINGSSSIASDTGFGLGRGGGMGGSGAYLYINGGYLYVNANGDGIDVNGPIEMTAGEVVVNGPTNSANGALDYSGSFAMTGGILVAVGSSGMAQAPSDSSTQYAVMHTFDSTQQAGTTFSVQTSGGQEILTFTPTKDYQTIVFSMPELQEGETYLILTGGSATGAATDGLYTGGTYTGGTQVASYTLTSMITGGGNWNGGGFTGGQGQGGGMPGGGGRPGGGGGVRPAP